MCGGGGTPGCTSDLRYQQPARSPPARPLGLQVKREIEEIIDYLKNPALLRLRGVNRRGTKRKGGLGAARGVFGLG